MPLLVTVVLALSGDAAALERREQIDVRGGCIEVEAVRARIERVLADRSKADGLAVRITSEPAAAGIRLSVTVIDGEAVVLERQYDLLHAECGEVPNLVGVVLERFLRGLPARRAAVSPSPAVVANADPVPADLLHELRVRLAGLANDRALQPELELAVHLLQVSGSPVVIGGHLRAGGATQLGSGEVALAHALVHAGAMTQRWGFYLEGGVSAGAVVLRGQGFDDDRTAALPWVEANAALSHSVSGSIAVGVQAAASPLRLAASTLDGEARIELARYRAGVFIASTFEPSW
jgi:hypothetical protein